MNGRLLGRISDRSWSVRLRAAVAAGVTAGVLFGLGVWWLRGTVYSDRYVAARSEAAAAASGIAATYFRDGKDQTYPHSLTTFAIADVDGNVVVSNGEWDELLRSGALRLPALRPPAGALPDGYDWTQDIGWNVTSHVRVGWQPSHPLANREIAIAGAATRFRPTDSPLWIEPASDELLTVWVLVRPYEADRAVSILDRTLLPGVPVAALLVAVIAWWVTRGALRPVEAIRRQLAEFTAHDTSRRVPVPGRRDEISRLAATTNETLDRLDAAFGEQRRFVADAAHELRTPLATLRNTLEVAVAHPETGGWPDQAATALGQARRLQDLADDLLLLARLDGSGPLSDRVVDLAALAEERGAERPGLRVDAPEPALVRGSEAELSRLLGNLVDNALRYATSTVTVQVSSTVDGSVVLAVADDGPGVPVAERERIFERFHRLDDDRGRAGGGTGLGLAIARDIVRRHGGTIAMTDNNGTGARVVVRLPAAPPGAA